MVSASKGSGPPDASRPSSPKTPTAPVPQWQEFSWTELRLSCSPTSQTPVSAPTASPTATLLTWEHLRLPAPQVSARVVPWTGMMPPPMSTGCTRKPHLHEPADPRTATLSLPNSASCFSHSSYDCLTLSVSLYKENRGSRRTGMVPFSQCISNSKNTAWTEHC